MPVGKNWKIALTDIDIYSAKFSDYMDQQDELYEQLLDSEKARADRYKVEKARYQYIISHGLMNKLFLSLGESLNFEFNQWKKPFLKESKRQFNLSHSKDYMLLAISDLIVGVDIEFKKETRNFEGLSRQFMHNDEITEFNALKGDEQMNYFFKRWSQKEALIKAIGQGMSYPVKSINLSQDRDKQLISLNDQKYHLSEIIIASNYSSWLSYLEWDDMKINHRTFT